MIKICQKINWKEAIQKGKINHADALILVEILFEISKSMPLNCSVWIQEEQFSNYWEQLAEYSQSPIHILRPYKFEVTPEIKELMQGQNQENSKNKSIEIQQNLVEGLTEYVMPSSPFQASIGESQHINEFKMLKYWEKYIIPKIKDYCKHGLKAYEIDDFMEQIRQPLRIGDITRTLEIAYIVCDQNMQRFKVPETSHDWSTLAIDEI